MAITPMSMWAAHEPANNEIWYTTNNGAKIVPDMKRWKANVTSIKFDKEKRCWIMTFDSDVTNIDSRAFHNCSSLHSITLPSSLLKIEEGAFDDCHIEKSHINNNTSFNLSKYGMKIINK